MPTGVFIPVANISIRVFIGCTHALVNPGNLTKSSSSLVSFFSVIPSRHSLLGFSKIVVSSIVSGAGSVAVSARPTLPKTRSTSGTVLISLSVCINSSRALPIETPGNVVGMYSRSPSSSSGINSLPIFLSGIHAEIITNIETKIVSQGIFKHSVRIGRYTQIKKREIGFLFSFGILPRII